MSKISKKIKGICKNITLKLENNSDVMALSYKEWRWKDEKIEIIGNVSCKIIIFFYGYPDKFIINHKNHLTILCLKCIKNQKNNAVACNFLLYIM